MCRAPRRCAPFTCTSARCSASSRTIGSGSVASPSARARNARSTALTATAKEILSRNASSGTTRISVGEHALQAAHLLDELERGDRLAVLHETNGAGAGRMPGEGIPEALQPRLEHGIVRLEDAP